MTNEKLEWGPDEGVMSHTEAVAFAAAKGDGWRLPTIKELVASEPSDEWYWAAASGDATRAWLVRPCNGNAYDTHMLSYPRRVRCVRSVGGES